MKYNIIYFRVILPAILSSAIVFILEGNLWLAPLIFGLIVGLVNWKVDKYNQFFGCLFSVFLSYVVFALGWFGAGFWKYILEYLFGNIFSKNDIFNLTFLITTFIIAPLLIYLLYRLLFKFPMTIFTLFATVFSIIILVCIVLFLPIGDDKQNLMSNFSVWHVIIWQLIVIMTLQIMIVQKEIFKHKRNLF